MATNKDKALLINAAESFAAEKGYLILSYWHAEYDEVLPAPYSPQFSAGDLLVEFCGQDNGSVPWIENYGQ